MTREEKIKAIYKEMANKEKTIGCKYLVYAEVEPEKTIEAVEEGEDFSLYFGGNDYAIIPTEKDYFKYYKIKEIIGHPVMIGDVMHYTAEKRIDIVWSDSSCALNIRDGENSLNLFNFWDNKRAPIEDQSDECIDYVYSLMQKN